MRGFLHRLWCHPLTWILVAAAGLRLAGLFWGLPASDGWDDDGFAPRNFLTALALTWKSGSYFTYPPLHAILLAILTLPGILIALLHVPSFHQADVIAEFTKPGYMTFFAVVGRLVNLAMSLGIIWAVGEMARLVSGRQAGLLAVGAAALNFGLTYYGQVSNLDVPYLFWAVLGLLWGMRAVMEQQPRRFWGAALFAACAVATKDQAYALFLLSMPLFLLGWFLLDRWPRQEAGAIARVLLPALAVALVLLLLVDGAITNWSGFLKRVAFLAGPASQDYAEYLSGPAGWRALLGDMSAYYGQGYGLVALTLAFLGLVVQVARARGAQLAAGLLPAFAILSFTVCFNFAALRSDDRFLLPQAVLACVYIGIAVDVLAFAAHPWIRLAARLAVAVTALFALQQVMAIDAAFLFDPRYEAERWMAVHVSPGDTIETYGQNCFLPRFPASAKVTRIGPGDLKVRNPLPLVTEVRAPFGAPRGARFIVVNAKWANRYLRPQYPLAEGHIYSRLQQADFQNSDARRYFSTLWDQRLGYHVAHIAFYKGKLPGLTMHDSLDEMIVIFERTA
jgi:4-amino-4-deoxy-L-arabinose transferase-like glycosyltransferase